MSSGVMPTGSNTDLPWLAKAESISDGGGTSGIADLTKGEKCSRATAGGKRRESM